MIGIYVINATARSLIIKNGNVAAFFSVLETKSATNEIYKTDMINMLIEIVNKNY